MKKLFLVATICFSTLVFSQRVKEGESQINAGIGFTSGWGIPVYGGFDYGIHEDITIGAQLSYASTSQNYPGGKNKGTWFGIGANGNYHFNTVLEIPDEWDVYAGLTLAYNSFTWDYSQNTTASGIGFAGQIGARYYVSDKFGINLEFGGGNITSGGKIGISFKL